MKKNQTNRLRISAETVRALSTVQLGAALGGVAPVEPSDGPKAKCNPITEEILTSCATCQRC